MCKYDLINEELIKNRACSIYAVCIDDSHHINRLRSLTEFGLKILADQTKMKDYTNKKS